MRFLPIIERELRVVARRPSSWWRRVVALSLAVGIFFVGYWLSGAWTNPARAGDDIFDLLVWAGFIYSLLAGPLATTDCISHERREGTLGLLFLTNLRSRDVVLGKMAVSSLDFFLTLMGALPLAAVPILAGGVDLGEFGRAALALFNVMFLSLAIGIFCSSVTNSGRVALGLSLLILVFLWGQPFNWLSPLYPVTARHIGRATKLWEYWASLAGLQVMAWLCILAACVRTSRSWRVGAESSWRWKLKERFARWNRWMGQRSWCRRLLDRNPLAWLESRSVAECIALLILFSSTTALWFYNHNKTPDRWPDTEIAMIWALVGHYGLCLWIAIQAPRRLADDKRSGALELLMCTPLRPEQIVRGCERALLVRFGIVAGALLLLDLYSLYYVSLLNHWWYTGRERLLQLELAISAALVIPIQTYTFIRMGLYQGLVQGNSPRATFKLIAKIGILPWVLFVLAVLVLALAEISLSGLSFPWFEVALFAAWTGCHLLVCGIFLAWANGKLKHHFRTLATQSAPTPWWQRWKKEHKLNTNRRSRDAVRGSAARTAQGS